ncbi:LytTR family two component transcriptional regulator [Chitinophaga skermanii]|uniref:LytTR family two component transcriptional regulator n=1 Tax=Chitinophaga skermanii TaxID=331697 RepID=A0A327QYJ0_9BACT|nr:LytTR family DNA-binding domain-containing protein [Chitinophaga skermanii]RAJ08828.1 LytTR family two component transcriptional regulator [Chitinophaga skermanii]
MMNNSINCIIIEDEKPAADILEHYVSKIELLHLVGTFNSGTQAMRCLNTHHIDLIFTDINMPGISGIDFIKSITPTPNVIFTTAHSEYAVEGFELNAVDYLLKPITFERFLKAVNRFIKLDKHTIETLKPAPAASTAAPFVFIKCEKKMVKIFLDDILYFESQKNYLLIYTTSGQHKTYHSISEMEEKLPASKFLRVHRSFIVAISKIEQFSTSDVTLPGATIPIGRHYAAATLQMLKQYQQG